MGDKKKYDDQNEHREDKEDSKYLKREHHDNKEDSKCLKREHHENKEDSKRLKREHHENKEDSKCLKKEHHDNKENSKRSKKEHCDHDSCQSCICQLLRKAGQGTMVRLVTDSGDIIEGKFIGFSEEKCCAIIEVNEIVSPPIPCEVVFVDCLKIESLVFIN
ncbi:hypothetical protein [Sporolactobacillus pectinivorans]|uniref:hypothetical protein n=1 Tax=Sporolactobacillus pectinivorans TaxID=1591408 RepID=UPI000C26722F|nr:hypothetical protein [Sporolactobacillus pectinivorans]